MAHLRMTPRRQLLCTEPLERRWLFSAPGESLRLPPEVAASIEAKFPRAHILEMESSVEEGRREYDIKAEFDGSIIDATFAADGRLLESERLRPSNPPQLQPPEPADVVPPPLVQPPEPPDAVPPPPEPPADAVEVVEVIPAEQNDDDVLLAPTELPAGVAAAIARLFPGARLIEAESDMDEGVPEVGVIAEFNGGVIDVSFAPDGRLIESQVPLDPSALPKAALQWVRRNYPNASISDAQAVTRDGRLTYEMTVAPPDGEAVEVSLSVGPPAGDSAGDAPVPVSAAAADDRAAVSAASGGEAEVQSETTGTRGATSSPPPAEAAADPRVVGRRAAESPAADVAPASAEPTTPEADSAAAVSSDESVAAGHRLRPEGPARRIHPIGAVLVAELGELERRLAEILRGLDLLAGRVSAGEVLTGSAGRAAAVVALLAASQVLLVDSRKTTPGRVKVFRAGAP